MFLKKISIALLLCTISLIGRSQTTQKADRYFEFGFSTNSYKGDLSHSYNDWANGIHLGIQLNKKKLLNGHFNLMIGNAYAQNPNYFFDDGNDPQPSPKKSIKIRMINVNYDLHLNVFKNKNFTFYLYQGIGICRFDPRDSENKKLTEQLNTRATGETYTNIAIMLPNGIGGNYILNSGVGIGLQAGWLNTSTDYLDNMSKWGDRIKNDNVLVYKMTVYIPIIKKETPKDTPVPTLE